MKHKFVLDGDILKRNKINIKVVVYVLILILFFVITLWISRHYSTRSNMVDSTEVQSQSNNLSVSTVFVPASVFQKSKTVEFLAQHSSEKPETVILIADRDTATESHLIYSSTGLPNVKTDTKLISDLSSKNIVTLSDDIIDNNEGINNNVNNILFGYPQSSIVPVVMDSSIDEKNLVSFSSTLFDLCHGQCLLMVAADFSDDVSGSLSEIQNDYLINALYNLDKIKVQNSALSSKQLLYFAIDWAKRNDTLNFEVFDKSNSSMLSDRLDGKTKSYVLASFQHGDGIKKDDTATFIIGGDMMFDRGIDSHFRGDKLYDVVSNLGDKLFANADLSMVNLEGPISETEIPADNTANNMIFNFPPKSVDVLHWMGVNSVSLANNHTNNNGKKGLVNTKNVLTSNLIVPVGQESVFDEESIKRFNSNNKQISVIALNILETNPDISDLIKNEKSSSSFVIVYPHWGTEYSQSHGDQQEILAHRWIDAGADLIVGSHPHVIQDAEVYKGKPIFYSLGNLLFDQNFSKETQRGLIVAGEIRGDKLKLVLLPIVSNNFKPELLAGGEKINFLSNFRAFFNKPIDSKAYGYDTIEF